jgi:cysteine synthase A
MAEGLIDEVVPVDGDDAMRLSRELARQEGIFAGTTSGATLAAAQIVARGMKPGSNIVCMLPDTGERYMSTPLFDDIDEDMNAAEIELSQSTPGCRFDIPSLPRDKVDPLQVRMNEPEQQPLDNDAERFVSVTIAAQPVVMFALVWCEFSWSVRKLFSRMNIEFRSIDLDSVKYQENDFGGKIRAVLAEQLGSPTIPQVFIGGRHIGGCTELFDAVYDGSMQRALEACGVNYDRDVKVNPYELLPSWVHPRKTA